MELELLLSDMKASSQNLASRLDDLSQKTSDLDAHYLKLQDSLGEVNSRLEIKDRSLETTLTDSQKAIKTIEDRLHGIEKANTDLQNQIITLQTQRTYKTDSRVGKTDEAMREETRQMIEQGREMIEEAKNGNLPKDEEEIKALVAGQSKEALQKLLDDALISYREGNYEEALRKWEEALVIDPENLEAKFNIEITREKIPSPSEQ
ncbi:MAG: tetratricopeptide repeat protein [Candidatus Brocadiaceae bacterium]|nr:tetratricopeptide repeat protein [Candidatus Brocadiaceae bacterium]